MAITNQIRIQVLVDEQTKWGNYRDALYYTQEQYFSLSQEDIDKEVFSRIARWGDSIDNPPIQLEPTEEELLAQKQIIQDQIDQLTAQKLSVDETLSQVKVKPIKGGAVIV